MAKGVFLLSAALCMLAFANVVRCSPQVFDVEGSVYCDTCRVQFENKLSEYIEGATVRLQCKNIETEQETYSVEAVTDKNGKYKLTVEGDHEHELCEVSVVKSPREDCKEAVEGFDKSRIVCSGNVGIHNAVRLANPLFFMKAEPVSGCKEMLEELGLFPLDLDFN